jgi:hypothetical protein
MSAPLRLSIVTKADLDRWERRARTRQRMQVVAGLCLLVVLACIPAALVLAVLAEALP